MFMQAYPGHTYRDVLKTPMHAFTRLLQASRDSHQAERSAEDAQWMREMREIRANGELVLPH